MKSVWREDIPLSTSPTRFFLFASRPYWKLAAVAMGSIIVSSTLLTSISYVFKYIVNAVAALSTGGSYESVLWGCLVYVIFLFIGQSLIRVSGFTGAAWATGIRATARHALTSYVTLHSRAYFSNRFAGSLASKISNASKGMADLMEQVLWQFLDLIVSIIASFVIAFLANPELGLVFLAWVLVIFFFNEYFARKRMPLTIHAQILETQLTGKTVDLLSNITAMQEYARRSYEMKSLQDAIDERRMAGVRNWHFGEWILTVNGVIQAFFSGAMILLAVQLAHAGKISVGDIVLVLTLIFRIEGLLIFLGANFKRFSDTLGEVRESLEEIVEPHEIVDTIGARQLSISEGAILFDRVSFTYGKKDADVLRDFLLSISGKEKIGLVGRSGAGKSTLAKLLLRQYEVTEGVVSIDGTNIADVTQDSLRESIALVPQEPVLFHRSLRDNVAYGNPGATEEEIVEAAHLAYAHDFIQNLPKGYDTLVGERGIKLSGGERQRIAIARAILKNAPILLLDEATSSLDSESEVEIQKALHELMRNKTVIAIAHRLSTLREMDRIIVLDRGAIVEEGTHQELLDKGGLYSELWRHQAGGFLQDE